jgi:hypothetical protein
MGSIFHSFLSEIAEVVFGFKNYYPASLLHIICNTQTPRAAQFLFAKNLHLGIAIHCHESH